MSLYTRDQERAIRMERLVRDWTESGLLAAEQRDRMLPELQVDLRRTNKFLRLTLFLFGFLIVNAATGLVAIFIEAAGESAIRWLALAAAIGCFAIAQTLVKRSRLYHFGVEEAAAMASVSFFVIFAGELTSSFSTLLAFSAATAGAALLFVRFGYVYAGVAAALCAPLIIFDLELVDTVRRLLAFVLLLTIVFVARERRDDHDPDYPADAYGTIQAVAWAAMYFIANLKISSWLSTPDDVTVFYWGTFVVIWMLPVAGLWMAVRDRHRGVLDVNIALAIVTLMSNKPYLGAAQKPWDPILLGVTLIVVAVGLRRWLASGTDESRSGFVAGRLLASERDRLALAGTASVLAPGGPEPHGHDQPPSFGGGRSGGGGASGSF